MNVVAKVLGSLAAPVVEFLKRRAELKQARFEAQLKFEQALGERRAQLILAGLAADANWEMEFAQQAATSWKDEFTLGLVSIPAVLCFIKTENFDGPGIVSAGFEALGKAPWYYLTIFCVMTCATVGVRWWRRTQYDTEESNADPARK